MNNYVGSQNVHIANKKNVITESASTLTLARLHARTHPHACVHCADMFNLLQSMSRSSVDQWKTWSCQYYGDKPGYNAQEYTQKYSASRKTIPAVAASLETVKYLRCLWFKCYWHPAHDYQIQ